jgi:hypothetical protein
VTKRWLVVAGLILVAMLAGGGIAWASIPGPDGVIHGCRKNSDGSLRAIDSAAICPNGWTALNWRQSGLSSLEWTQETVSIPAEAVAQDSGVSVMCPAGKLAVGGGGNGPGYVAVDQTFGAFVLRSSYPITSGNPAQPVGWRANFWRVGAPNQSAEGISAHVICVAN